jgi:putative redox protein
MQTTLTHTGGMAFDVEIEGFHFTVDAAPEVGGNDLGPRPKPLMLAALAGCTGMDVVSMLAKMRQTWTRFQVRVEADLTAEHPKVFQDFTVVFEIDGEVDPGRLARAIALSRDRYCGVSAMYRAHAPVRIRAILNGEEQPEPPPAG